MCTQSFNYIYVVPDNPINQTPRYVKRDNKYIVGKYGRSKFNGNANESINDCDSKINFAYGLSIVMDEPSYRELLKTVIAERIGCSKSQIVFDSRLTEGYVDRPFSEEGCLFVFRQKETLQRFLFSDQSAIESWYYDD